MQVKAIKTEKILLVKQDLLVILDKYLPIISDNSVVAVTSKIISICEGRFKKIGSIDKQELIRQESELYIPLEKNKYGVAITVKDNHLIASAGVDESNGDGFYILWPSEPQKSANSIREYLMEKFKLKKVGVVITDSITTPLRWGVRGFAIAHSGFEPLNNYIGTEDIFGHKLKYTKVNVMDALAAAAAAEMGEGPEQTPLAIITEVPWVHFQDRNPTIEELDALKIEMKDDLYWPLLSNAPFEKSHP